MRVHKRLAKLVSVLAVLAIVAAACGDDDDDTATSEPAGEATTTAAAPEPEATTTAAAPEPEATTTAAAPSTDEAPEGSSRGVADGVIKIGGLGQLDFFPGMEEGARARFEAANESGEVEGYTFEYVGLKDDGSDAAGNLDLAKDLVESEEVFAIVPATSAVMLPQTTDYLAENEVPFLGWGFMPGFCSPNEWGFGFNGCLSGFAFGVPGAGLSTAVKDPVADLLGVDTDEFTVGIFNSDDAAGEAGAKLYETLWSPENLLFNDFAPVESQGGITDPSPFVQQVLDTNPDAVILSVDFGGALALKPAIIAAGYEGPVLDYTTYVPGLPQSNEGLAAALEGGYSNTQFPAQEEGGEGVELIAAQLEAIGEPAFVTQGGSIGWWSADVFIQMVKQTLASYGRLDTGSFNQAINVDGFTYQPYASGSIGPLSFPEGHLDPVPCAGIVQLVDAEYTPVVPFTCYEVLPPPE